MEIINKPWGHEIIWARTERYVGKVISINPCHRLSRQFHQKKDETFFIIKGEMTLQLGEPGSLEYLLNHMRIGDSFHCEPGVIHRMCAGPEGAEVVEVSTPELDDVVRLDDDYGR